MADYFISDLHLSADDSKIFIKLKDFLQYIQNDLESLYILGDLFNYWLGDDAVDDFSTEVFNLFKDLKKPVKLMVGNRDFLLSAKLLAKYDISLIDDPFVIEYKSNKTLVTHGDLFCLHDIGYMNYRKEIRDEHFLEVFLQKSLKQREKFVKSLREQSYENNKNKDPKILDVSVRLVEKWVKKYQVKTVIHGHTHKQQTHKQKNYTRVVLSDWYKKNISYYKVTNQDNGVLLNF
jgi:UDP-2,3-diacylglucosamine hydrolase